MCQIEKMMIVDQCHNILKYYNIFYRSQIGVLQCPLIVNTAIFRIEIAQILMT